MIMSVKQWTNTNKARLYQSYFTRRSLYNVLLLSMLLPFLAFRGEGSIASQVFKLSAEDQRLDNCLIYETQVASAMDCSHLCLSKYPQCKSINFEKGGKQYYNICQLNNETKGGKPDKLVRDAAFNYFEPVEQNKHGNFTARSFS